MEVGVYLSKKRETFLYLLFTHQRDNTCFLGDFFPSELFILVTTMLLLDFLKIQTYAVGQSDI